MERMRILPFALLLCLAVAGCLGGDDGSGTTTTTTTTAPTSAAGQGTVTGVTIDAPKPPSGGRSEVCWHVAGSGNVAHVALHWDTESHAAKANRTFADYDAGAAYPGNAATLSPIGYGLPGDFCAMVDTPASGALYVVGHAIDRAGAPGRVSSEVVLPSTAAPMAGIAQAPAFSSIPATAAPGSKVVVCWSVAGTGTVPHTAIHWDNATHAGAPGRTFAMYDLGASYPGNQSQPAPSGYTLQATGTRFCTAAAMPATGSIFVVAHVIDSTGAPGKISEEREVKPQSGGSGGTALLTMRQFAFVPTTLSVAPGATVTVRNEDGVKHTATGSGFGTGDVLGGATATFTVPTAPGDYAFSCAYHSSMQGTLVVA